MPTVPGEAPPIPATAPAVAPQTAVAPVPAAEAPAAQSLMPAGTQQAAGGVLRELEAQGFEGLDIGFGSFPMVRLQDQTFSTNEGDTLGNTFLCIIHGSRTKWLYKAEDNN